MEHSGQSTPNENHEWQRKEQERDEEKPAKNARCVYVNKSDIIVAL